MPLSFLHDYNVKMPNFVFYGDYKQAMAKCYFSFLMWIWSLRIQLSWVRLDLTKKVGRNKD